jgi:hypothetical protein
MVGGWTRNPPRSDLSRNCIENVPLAGRLRHVDAREHIPRREHVTNSLAGGDLAGADRTSLVTALERVLDRLHASTTTPGEMPGSRGERPSGEPAIA